MGAYLVTNRAFELDRLDAITQFQARRGLGGRTCASAFGITFVHHLPGGGGKELRPPVVHTDIAGVYDGAVYNFAGTGILDAYRDAGPGCFADLDGEFAICVLDVAGRRLVCATDVFGTKPLWFAFEGEDFAVASYASVLRNLGFAAPQRLGGNSVLAAPLEDLGRHAKADLVTFDLRQHKRSYDDCIAALLEAVRKRSSNTPGIPFLGLSSGYDSGAIAAALLALNAPFRAYSIAARENRRVLDMRLRLIRAGELIELSRDRYDHFAEHLRAYGEEFQYETRHIPNYNYKCDPASAGLGYICDLARRDGSFVYLSGQGGDEILGAYGRPPTDPYSRSEFGGPFPEDLSDVFPWDCFFDSTQVHFLGKEELTSGTFGIEARYPLLDRAFVQEYLWLSTELKNRTYKAPLHEFLLARAFPFEAEEKIGFSADVGLFG